MGNNNLINLENQINKDLGVNLSEIDTSGKIQRFDIDKKNDKAGWLSYRQWSFQGKDYSMCVYGSWKDGIKRKWKSWNKQDELSTPGLTKSVSNFDKELKKEQEEYSLLKKQEILQDFNHFKNLDSNNFYLQKKKITTTTDLLEDIKSNLIVPIYSDIDKSLEGYQKIKKDFKQFPTGQKVQGNFFFFGDIKNHDFVYVCEGMATGATIYELTKTPTVVAFQANNLPHVVKKIQHQLKGVKVIIAADNDQKKTNAGMFWAKRAQDNSNNIAIVCPSFPKNSELTDFNDLFCQNGADETLRQLYFDESNFVDIEFLGFLEGKYFFYSTKTQEIRHFSLDKLKSGHLIEIAVESYWAQRYTPVYDKDTGLPTNYCDWKKTSSKIIKEQNDLGSFQGDKIRGVGSWSDNSNHVINLGDTLLLNGEKIGFGKNKALSKFYKPSTEFVIEFNKNPKKDFSSLLKAFKLIDFKSDRDMICALGFVAYAQIFSTRRWRPHIWVRADKGTGKSSLLEFVNEIIPNSQMFQDTTSAGIRQTVGVNSRVCLIDEAEGESNRTKQIIELARQASSGSKTTIARGTPDGVSINFNPQMCFFFASIRAAELTPADESRILQISMQKPNRKSLAKLNELKAAMKKASSLGNDLFWFMNNNLKRLRKLIQEVHDALIDTGVFDSRYADQHAPIIAAYSMLDQSLDLTDIIAKVCKQDVSQDNDKKEDSDQFDFYNAFLNVLIRHENEERPLYEICAEYLTSGIDRKKSLAIFLLRYGIEFKDKKNCFWIGKNQNFKNLMSRQTKYQNYYAQMKDNLFFQNGKNTVGSRRGFEFNLSS